MTLTTSIAATTKTLTLQVRVGGVLVQPNNPTLTTGIPGIESVSIRNRIGSAPVCSISVNRTPAWVARGMVVTVDVGYDGFTRRRFTGTVQDRSKGVGKGTINCAGSSSPLYTTSIIPDQNFSGQTTAAALATICAYVGVLSRSITTTRSDVAEFTMGTVVPTILRNMSAAQMAQYVMELQGCKMYETGAGVTVINVVDDIPAGSPVKTYTTNANATARILSSDQREDATFVRTRVKVNGATASGGTTLVSTAQVGGASLLVKPPLPSSSYIDSGIFNSLADTQAKVDAMALFYLTQWHRVPKYLDIELPGDPELECAQTLGLVIPEQDINGNFFIAGWEDTITMSGNGGEYRTTLAGLRGGDDLGGTLSIAPVTMFTMTVEREVFGTGATDFVVVTLDSSGSYDPDGSLTTVAIWTSNKTTTPTMVSSTAAVRTVRIDSASLDGTGTDWTITLQRTDSTGASTSITQTVPYPPTGTNVVIPAIGLAYNSGGGFSPDGGQHWNDKSGSTCISVANRPADGTNFGHMVFGFSDGHITRTTDNNVTQTTVLAAVGSPINCLAWDWRNGNVVWALTSDMSLYVSLNAGASWGLYGGVSLLTTLGLPDAIAGRRAIGLPAAGGVYVFGGTGTGVPLIAYDALLNNTWVTVTFTGDLATDIATPADVTMRIVDYTAPGFGTEAMILEWSSGGGASLVAIYSTTTPPGPSRAYTRATGLTAGLKTGRYIVGDVGAAGDGTMRAGFANQDTWSATNGVAFVKTASVMPTGVTPNDCMLASGLLTGYPDFQGLYLIAAENAGNTVSLYKSADGLQTVTPLRPAGGAWATQPASGKGKYISIGAPGATVPSGLAQRVVAAKAGSPALAYYPGTTAQFLSTSIGANFTNAPSPFVVTSTNWIVLDQNGLIPDSSQLAQRFKAARRTADGGLTWSASAIGDENAASYIGGFAAITRAADGRLWAARAKGEFTSTPITTDIYYSDDSGATWVFSFNFGVAADSRRYPFLMSAHPTNANLIALLSANREIGDGRLVCLVSADRGATWTVKGNSTTVASGNNEAFNSDGGDDKQFYILQNGRFLLFWANHSSPFSHIWTSDDNGDTWTRRVTETTHGFYLFAGANASGSKLVAVRAAAVAMGVGSDFGVYVSTDSGVTWGAIATTAPTALQVADNDWNVKYNIASDTLYVGLHRSAPTVTALYKFSPVDSTGVWTNISENIPALTWKQMDVLQ